MNLLNKPSLWRTVLVVMLAALAVIGFWPSPVDAPAQGNITGVLDFLHIHGIPRWVDYSLMEKSANVVLFIPFGIAAALAYPGENWWQHSALGLGVSGCMELGQLLFLHNRVSSITDIVTNSGGSVIGAIVAVAVLRSYQQQLPKRVQTATGPTPSSGGPVKRSVCELVD